MSINIHSMTSEEQMVATYELAKERYAALSVDTDKALETLETVSISLQCWQGDDVRGFENVDGALTGGIAVTGDYPGRARNAEELRQDLDAAYGMIPGKHRLSLHAIYAETDGKKVERNALRPEHFAGWVAWAKEKGHALDFNPTCFSHPLAASGLTLASPDPAVRQFWVEHCITSREIGESFGKALGAPCVTNLWVPDGMKDTPVNRAEPRELLKESLDRIYAQKTDRRYNLDAVEGKLFGIGSESYVVGSHEFYLAYAIANKIMPTLDMGHYHPTESVADKLTAVMLFTENVLLHISRGVRWDSDHVPIQNDDLQAVAQELVRGNLLHRAFVGLDYFDASINRVAAWVIGARAVQKSLLMALLEPHGLLFALEKAGDYTARLAQTEALKAMPWGAVWNMFCLQQNVPVRVLDTIREYERRVSR